MAVEKLMAENSTLGSSYHKFRAAYEDGKAVIMMAEQKASATLDDARQLEARLREFEDRLKAEVFGAKLTGAREFKVSKVFQSLVSRAVGEGLSAGAGLVLSQLKNKGLLAADVDMSHISLAGDESSVVVEPSLNEIANARASQPDPFDPFYSLLDEQADDVVVGSNGKDPTGAGPSGAGSNGTDQYVLAGGNDPTGAEPSGAGPSGTGPDAEAGPSPDAGARPP